MKHSIYFLIKDNKFKCIIGLFVSIIFCFFVTLMPIISQYLIDVVLATNEVSKVYYGIGIFFIVCIIQPILYCIKEEIFLKLCENISYSLRIKSFTKLSNLTVSFYETHNFGEISIKIMSDTKELSSFVYVFFSSFITSILVVVLLIIAMFYESWFLSIIIIGIFIIYIIFSLLFTKKFKKLSKESLKLSEKLQSNIKQRFDNSVLNKVFISNNAIENKSFDIVKSMKTNNLKIRRSSNWLSTLGMLVTAFALCIIYGIGALLIIDGKTTLGVVVAMGLFYQSFTSPVSSIIFSNVSYNKIKPSIERMKALFNEEEEKGNVLVDENNPSIVFENVTFKYPNGSVNALNSFSFNINGNGIYAISGSSGKGKSTIAKLILGLYLPTSGEINVFGTEITEADKKSLRKSISYISQDIELINDSIIANLLISYPSASFSDIDAICTKLKIKDKIMSLDDDYYSIITEKINLSGGERRRIGIARGLIKPAKIYIFDEAESYLDDAFKEILKGIFVELAKKSIVIIISHDTEMIKCADKVIEL